jgi:hypothetical protein
MKTLFAAVWIFALALCCRAQVTDTFTLSTNAFAAATTNTITSTSLDTLHFNAVGFFVSAKGLGAATDLLTLKFGVSNVDSNYIALPTTMSFALDGTNTARGWTNFPATGFRWITPTQVLLPATNGITNLTIQWLLKPK